MRSSEALPNIAEQKVQRTHHSIGPILSLFFTAPLVAEYLLGNLPIKLLPALIVLAPMYGGGALLIREIVRRSGRGWPSILLLGMAYGILEEAYITQSLFNPNYLKLNLGLLTPAFIPALGVSAWWTLWMLMVHGLWSISTPIALIESCVPSRAHLPWAGRVGLAIIVVVFGVGVTAVCLMNYHTDPFLGTRAQFAGAALAIIVFVGLAFLVPFRPRCESRHDAPSALVLGITTVALGSAVMLVPKNWGWGAVGALLALDGAMLLVILAWSRRGAMRVRHQLALGSGAALAYGIHAFVQHPSVGKLDPSVRIGNVVFLIAIVALIAFATRRVRE